MNPSTHRTLLNRNTYYSAIFGTNDSSFKKYRVWRACGTSVSPKSRLALEVRDNNKSTRSISSGEIYEISDKKKAYNAIYFWPIRNILEMMARNGKISGIYLNNKQGWHFDEISFEDIITTHKLKWKVRYEKFDEFLEDLEQIRNYRIHFMDKDTTNPETIKVINDMLNDEWTMNNLDGNISRKQLWIKYRTDSIKMMNLEFRLKCNESSKGITEIPIVLNEDCNNYHVNRFDVRQLEEIEDKWRKNEPTTNVPNKKRKKTDSQKGNKTKKIRIGTEEMLDELKEIKSLLLSLKENPNEESNIVTFDKFDQLREVDRSVHDEETKEIMRQIILSRQDKDDLKYNVLEEELLSGKNYLIQMPEIEKIRTNILGMVQEIDNSAPGKWKDNNLIDRLQIITGIRMKKLICNNLANITKVLINFRKEIEIVNDFKTPQSLVF